MFLVGGGWLVELGAQALGALALARGSSYACPQLTRPCKKLRGARHFFRDFKKLREAQGWQWSRGENFPDEFAL